MHGTRHDLVEEHLGLARGLAARYRHRGIPTEDLEQIAYLGLVRPADRFRDDSGHDFGAYATPTVTGEIRRYFRDHGWAVRPPRRLQELRTRLVHEDTAGLTDVQVAEKLGATLDELREVHRATNAYSALSLDVPRHDVAGTRTRPTPSTTDDLLSLKGPWPNSTTGNDASSSCASTRRPRSRRSRRNSASARCRSPACSPRSSADCGATSGFTSRAGGHQARPSAQCPRGAPAWSRTPSSSSTRTSRAA